MYGHYNLLSSRSASSLCHTPSHDVTEALPVPTAPFPIPNSPLAPDQLGWYEFDWLSETLRLLNTEVSNSCSSESSSYPSPTSLASYGTQRPSFIQRSVSSHSLQKNGFNDRPVSTLSEFLDSEGPLRKVYSTGDLQGKGIQRMNSMGQRKNQRSESPLMTESNMIIEGMSKACKYSPEVKKERIERYRTKRNQRNFTKKIKYACRKTLADSRPRIRGRFARNEENEKNSAAQWSHASGEEEEEDDSANWISFLDSYSTNLFT